MEKNLMIVMIALEERGNPCQCSEEPQMGQHILS